MAAIPPTALFPSYTFANGSITISLADLPGLLAAEADATTGDGRALSMALAEAQVLKINALAPNARPAKMSATKSNPTGTAPGQARNSITFGYDVVIDPTNTNLVAES